MPTANEELLDAIVRHQTYLLRYSGSVRNRMWAILDASEEDIALRIRAKLADSEGLTSSKELKRLQALVDTVAGMRERVWEEAADFLEGEMTALAYQEPIVLQGIVQTVAPVVINTVLPGANLLRSIALSRPFEGRLLRDWADAMKAEDIRKIHAAIQMGMVSGEGSDAIARRVVGTGLMKGTDGVTELTRRQVAAVTRTAVQHVANGARREFMLENQDVIEQEAFVATLDSRTTPVCRANDGKRYPVGQGPQPPLHIGCRSLRVAVLGADLIGNRPYKASTTRQLLDEYTSKNGLDRVTTRADLPKGTKTDYDKFAAKRVRELTGRVPAQTNYQQWLEKQSKQFQEDTLGKAKAALFRDGGLKLDKFIAANGSELTLAQLAGKHAEAFRAAGLDPANYL